MPEPSKARTKVPSPDWAISCACSPAGFDAIIWLKYDAKTIKTPVSGTVKAPDTNSLW
jgi:hypothetical protein